MKKILFFPKSFIFYFSFFILSFKSKDTTAMQHRVEALPYILQTKVCNYILRISNFWRQSAMATKAPQFNRHPPMPRLRWAGKCLFLLFTLYSSLFTLHVSFALRQESASYASLNGSVNSGGKYLNSPSFESSAGFEELACSSWTSASYMLRSGHLSRFPLPSPINDFNAVIMSTNSITLIWSAPVGDSERNYGTVTRYIVRFSSVSAISSENDFLNAQEYVQNWTPLEFGAGESKTVSGFNPAITYYFAIESVNEHMLRSEHSNMAYAIALVPLSPLNFNLTSSSNSVTLTWLSPAGYKTGIKFNDRFNPVFPYEISGYHIFRATSAISDNWQFMASVSSYTLNWAGMLPTNDEYYYHVKAENYAGFSDPSSIMGSISKTLQYVSPDRASVLEIPKEVMASFISASNDPMNVYTIEFSSHPEEIQGRIVKSVEFSAYKGGITKDNKFKFNGLASLNLYYRKSGDTIIPSGVPTLRSPRGDIGGLSAGVPDYKRMSIYYYNGSKWMQLYGKVDESKQMIQLQTKYPGKYQIRLVERLGGFSADASGISNRMITPNEDGKNDVMVFVFDYSEDVSKVKGKIYDLKGAFVENMKIGPLSNSLTWNGKSGETVVPGGVYIYQIECEGKVYNGTVAVIK